MINLYDILQASNGQLFGEPAAQIFTGFAIDAERAARGSLFLALKTDRGDSHIYIGEAIENGASGVICTRPPEVDTSSISVILVRDTMEALLAWSHYILRKVGVKVVAVTGSMGKSVAVDAISRVLRTRYSVHVDARDYEGKLGIPLALAGVKPSHDFVVIKLATTRPGEMSAMVKAVQPEVGVITHLTDVGSGSFESAADITSEYATLVDSLSPNELAVLNYDNERLRGLANRAHAQVRSIGIDSFDADVMAYNIVVGLDGTGFDLRCGGERTIAHRIPILGRHHVYSIMSALAVGMQYEIPVQQSLKALELLDALPGRMNPLIGEFDSLIIDDTYNANTESTLAALEWLQEIKTDDSRVIFVLSDMSGSPRRNHAGYRLVGQRAAEVVDLLVTQGTEAAQAARAALDMGMDPLNVYTTYSAYDTVVLLRYKYSLNENDIVLIKGSSESRMEQVAKSMLKLDSDTQRLPRFHAESANRIAYHHTRSSWLEIDRDALSSNIRALKNLIGPKVELMAVVKSDAYGHGAISVSQTALLNGATYLGVSSIMEALELREAGITAPILVMNYTPTALVRQALRQNITLTVYDLDLAGAYDRLAREMSGQLKVHVKVDTGMGRLGVMPDDTINLFRHLLAMQNLDIEGIYTHFSVADEDPEYTQQQIDEFKNVLRPLRAATGKKFRYVHTANSAATIAHPESHFDIVRPGLAMYGLQPSETVQLPEAFKPVMTWKTSIAQVKTLPPGHPIGYGNTYVTARSERVAVLPVGYSDGLRRGPQNWGEVLVHGRRVPIRGRVSMEKTVISVDHIAGVSIGDEVVLLGTQGDDAITAEEVGIRTGTINYEIVCSILPRVPRE